MTQGKGGQSFANIINQHTDLSPSSGFNEDRDNSIDASSTEICSAYIEKNDHIYYIIIDNGKSMSPLKIFEASSSSMKSGNSIGYYFRGALSSLLSKRSDTTYMFTREEGKPLYLVKTRPDKLRKFVDIEFKNGKSGDDISAEIWQGTNRIIYGPYIENHEDDPITKNHLDESSSRDVEFCLPNHGRNPGEMELKCFHWLLASPWWRSQFRWQQISVVSSSSAEEAEGRGAARRRVDARRAAARHDVAAVLVGAVGVGVGRDGAGAPHGQAELRVHAHLPERIQLRAHGAGERERAVLPPAQVLELPARLPPPVRAPGAPS